MRKFTIALLISISFASFAMDVPPMEEMIKIGKQLAKREQKIVCDTIQELINVIEKKDAKKSELQNHTEKLRKMKTKFEEDSEAAGDAAQAFVPHVYELAVLIGSDLEKSELRENFGKDASLKDVILSADLYMHIGQLALINHRRKEIEEKRKKESIEIRFIRSRIFPGLNNSSDDDEECIIQ